MPSAPTILILGGTGNFGARIVRRLSQESGLKLIVSSRSAARAKASVDALGNVGVDTEIETVAVDQDSDSFAEDLGALAPDVVLHTAGPYQGRDYRVAGACIDVGSHYIDLADGRDFVCDIGSLDEEARRADLLLVSGASTLPAISSAVVDDLREKFSTIESIGTSIAPAHKTPRGEGTVAAVLSYCGRPIKCLRGGDWHTVYGWQDLRVQNYPALGRRLSAVCDVPDLSLFPEYVPGVRTVSFHVSLEAFWEHLGLWSMACLSRLGIVSDWSNYVPSFAKMSDRLQMLGSDRGGMHMRIAGESVAGRPLVYDWYLTAEENHGPEIPCTPAIVLARKLAHDELSQRGAMPCLGLMSIHEILDELSAFAISSEIKVSG